ncbi:hypothetical protein OSB04_016271 [Centaurea solstitialis]|uniref:NB-ARC domain-containing protein n=1 Tax=Centaurea solstitialis TaxID=347529 RepID=A0AA38TDV8_9ASTR|nr:hypothetical protein OSB04_016271 [Centaurea solstitialis]
MILYKTFTYKDILCPNIDDVDNIEQLRALAGDRSWFKKGSVIIITTRDEQVLRSHDVEPIQVNLLSNEEALSLFCMNAFGTKIPVQEYKELSQEVVNYAAGLPLTITVLGSHVRGRSTCGWNGVLESLKRMPKKEVVDILELSYTSLEDDIKEIFLDIACMSHYHSIDNEVIVLESCGHFQAKCGLDVLKEKSLITISNDGEVVMHDQIIEIGRNIVRRPHRKEPHKRSHLWEMPEIEHILANDLVSIMSIRKGIEATECIHYVFSELHSELFMKGLRKMKKLRYLYAYTRSDDVYCFSGDCEILQLWEGEEKKILKKLKYIYIWNSKLKTLDLGMTPNLVHLDLTGCRDLVELLFPLQCPELTIIDLSYTKLRILELCHTPNLVHLDLAGCCDLVELVFPHQCPKLTYIDLSGTKLRTLDLRGAPNLESLNILCDGLTKFYLGCCKLRILDLQATTNLTELSLEECVSLEELHITTLNLTFLALGCPKFRTLDFLGTPNLESLIIACDDLAELYIPAIWPKLKSFTLYDSKLTALDLQGAQNLETLYVRGCYNLEELRIHFNCLKLESIDIMGAKLRSFDLALTPNLKMLRLTKCSHLVVLQAPEDLGLLECLEDLILSECTGLRDIPNNICKMKRLERFHLRNCVAVEKLPGELGLLECLKELNIEGTNIRHLPQSVFEMKGLRIVGFRRFLELFGFSEIQTSEDETFCYVDM